MGRTCTSEMCKCLSIVTWSCHVDMIIFEALIEFFIILPLKIGSGLKLLKHGSTTKQKQTN